MDCFEHIFQPIKIGTLTAKNRIEVSPAEPFLCTQDGQITEEFLAFTAELAKSGAAIVTVGDSPVTQAYADSNRFVVNLADPYIVHGLVRVAEVIHRYGAIASIELNLRDERRCDEFTRGEIHGFISDFAAAAERCKKAGFDMLMLHFGHGHTAASFYSPHTNKRTDEYGCSTFENRCRFANELIDAVRARVGRDMPIELRFSGDELYPEGVHLEEGLKFVRAIEDKIDLIHISAGSMAAPQTMEYVIQHTYMPRATNAAVAAYYKAAGLKIPVVSVGSYDVFLAEKALSDGTADMIAMIRPFIADPEMLNKARAGRADEIRPCIRCNVCTGDDPHGCPKPLRCTVNAVKGRELDFGRVPHGEGVVAVVGGGCAGMEAARRLARRGYRVVLFEKNETLGGSLIAAGGNTIKSDVRRYARWSVDMTLKDPNIEVRTGVCASPADIERLKPDALIVAVGGEQIKPRVDGIDGESVCFAAQLDTGEVKAGRRVVIIGAGLTGSESAVELARSGHEVTVIDMLTLGEIRSRDSGTARVHAMAEAEGVRFYGGMKLCAVTDGAVIAQSADGGRVTFECDTAALSLGVRPRTEEARAFEGACARVYFAGDCRGRRGNITDAVREGFFAAMNV